MEASAEVNFFNGTFDESCGSFHGSRGSFHGSFHELPRKKQVVRETARAPLFEFRHTCNRNADS